MNCTPAKLCNVQVNLKINWSPQVSSWHQSGVVNFITAEEDSIEVTATPGLLIPVIILTEMPIVQVDEMSKGSFGHDNPSTINGTCCSSTCGLKDSIMCETRARNKRPKWCVCVCDTNGKCGSGVTRSWKAWSGDPDSFSLDLCCELAEDWSYASRSCKPLNTRSPTFTISSGLGWK